MAHSSQAYVTLSQPLASPLDRKLLPVAIDGANILATQTPSFLRYLIHILSPCPAIYLVINQNRRITYRSLCRHLSALPSVHIIQAPFYPLRRPPLVPKPANAQQLDQGAELFLTNFGLDIGSLEGLKSGPPGLLPTLARWMRKNNVQAWDRAGGRQTLSMDDLLVIFCAKASNGFMISGDAFADVCRMDHSHKLAEFIRSRQLVARAAPPRQVHLFYPERSASIWDIVCSPIPVLHWRSIRDMLEFLNSPQGAPPPMTADEFLHQAGQEDCSE